MTKDYPFDEEDARQFYRWLRHEPGEFTEVRVIEWIHPDVKDSAGKTVKGEATQCFVTNEEDFTKVCKEWNGIRQVYAGINPRCRKSGKAEDVKRITGFPFDIDAPTPNKRAQAANDTEVKCAENWKTYLVDLATQQFGIEPYVDFSGNGHRVCLPCNITVTNEADIDAKLKLFFAEYKQKLCLPDFDNISDLPRIIKVPGTWSLKGNHTEQRPHRQAKLIQLGEISEDKITTISDYISSLKPPEKAASTQQPNNQPIQGLNPLKIIQLRPCFLDFINNPQRHRLCVDSSKDSRNTETGLRKALVLEMFFAGFNKEDTLMVCQKFDDYNKEKNSGEIDRELDKLDPKYKNWTCKSIHENGGCIGETCQYYKRKVLGQESENELTAKPAPEQGTDEQDEDLKAKTEPIIPGDIKKVTYAEAPSLLAQGYEVTKRYAETVVVEKKAAGLEQTNDDKPIESQADRLIKYCLAENPDIFFDQHKNGFVRVKLAFPLRHYGICGIPITLGEDENKEGEEKREASPELLGTPQTAQCRNPNEQKHNVIMPMGSQQFKKWLSYLMYLAEQKAPGNDSLNSAINVLGGKAQAEGMQYTLYNRVAPAVDGFYIDMADDRDRAIHVTAKGWKVVNDYPILFKHYSHQQPLAEPLEKEKEKGDAWKLLKYINIKVDDESSRLALLCSVISYFIPLIAHPAIVASGAQGTCKSWFFSLIRKVMDPSSIELLTVPTDEKAMAQHCEHNWLVPYDNITYLPAWGSDMLCRAITGGGISVRKLYTDDEDIVLNFNRCVMLNGINIAAQKGDLLDRAMLFTLEPIAQKDRKTEKDLNAAFEKDRALIFTGFLNVLSKALEYYPDIKLKEVQRLSDFNFYGCAIAKALGKLPEDFIIAYRDMVAAQNEEALNSDLVAVAILKFVDKCIKHTEKMDATGKMVAEAFWEDQPLVLFNYLKDIAEFTLGIAIKTNKAWPKTPSALSRRINAASANLKAVGVEIVNYKGNPRRISIDAKNFVFFPTTKTPEEIAQKEAEAKKAAEPPTDTRPKFIYKTVPSAEKCESCSSFAVTKVVLTPQGSTLRKCEECFKKLQTAFPGANFSREGAS